MLVWENTACDCCGADDARILFDGPDRLLGLPGCFRLVQCLACGLIRQDPRLAWESLKDYYAGDYLSYAPLIRDEASRWRRLDRRYGIRKQMKLVEHYQRGGRLLDVGSGTGIFLEEAARTRRWRVAGVEPNPQAGDYARQALQVEVLAGRFSDFDLPGDSFDVVTMWNVLEHLPSPMDDLRRAQRLLRPGGHLVFTVPQVESVEARLFGRYWVGWDLPRHLFLFPRATLQVMLAAAGFRVVAQTCISGTHAAYRDSFDFWSQSWPPAWQRHHAWIRRVYCSLPARAALGVPFWLLNRLQRSTILTVVAEKAGAQADGQA